MGSSTGVNKLSIVNQDSGGTTAAFPDVCKVPTSGGTISIPFPNIAQSADSADGSVTVSVDGKPICLKDSCFSTSTGDEAGSVGGVKSGTTKGKAEFINAAFDVKVEGKGVARSGDLMVSNSKNTPPAPVMQGPVDGGEGDTDEAICLICEKPIKKDSVEQQKHFLSSGGASPHHVEAGLENGGCLTGHQGKFKPNHSCSYRWQAVERSRSHRRPIYDLDFTEEDKQRVFDERDPSVKVRRGFLKTSAYFSTDKTTGRRTVINPAKYATEIKIPRNPKDWWVGKGKNFQEVIIPWWNNAHHVIPKGLFNKAIDDGAKGKPLLRDLVVCSLIESRYNINHYGNVILLPMDQEVAIMYRLPRHLVLEDETEIKEEGSRKLDHAKYSGTVKLRLRRVIQNYMEACDAALARDCSTKFIRLSKTQLEKLSRDCYAEITEHARTSGATGLKGGKPLSELRSIRDFRRTALTDMPY
jgi:uncharacterized Zn-binding protein involved in type VI secretion